MVAMIDEHGTRVPLHTYHRKPELEMAQGSKLELRAQWRGSRLEVEKKYESAKVVSKYSLSTTTDQLFVIIRLELDRMRDAVEFRRFYDPAATSR